MRSFWAHSIYPHVFTERKYRFDLRLKVACAA